jgi:hypothetical protein
MPLPTRQGVYPCGAIPDRTPATVPPGLAKWYLLPSPVNAYTKGEWSKV